ncbi:N-acetyltransferase [Entomospira entomophila]|nr:N-acetyltransferase [Entomospira entomophilus]
MIDEKDYDAIMIVTREAFWNLYRPGCEEHLVAYQIFYHPDWIRELSYVIEVNQRIVGAVFYTRGWIEQKSGNKRETLVMGPLCILPELHRQGLGRRLMENSISKAKELGYSMILTLGYDYHYAPYGFVSAKRYDIALEANIYYKGLLALALVQGSRDHYQGIVELSDAYQVNPLEVELFDTRFPPKQKKVMPSQQTYEKAIVAIDETIYSHE